MKCLWMSLLVPWQVYGITSGTPRVEKLFSLVVSFTPSRMCEVSFWICLAMLDACPNQKLDMGTVEVLMRWTWGRGGKSSQWHRG